MATDNSNNNDIRRFDGDLTNDVTDYHVKDNQWTYMRNGTKEYGTDNVTNEPANKSCIKTTYPIIGYIYIYDDLWAVFSSDGVGSEIGLFKDFVCSYTILVTQDGSEDVFGNKNNCLNFHPDNLITGISKKNFDCTWNIYWSDKHRNPDRTLNVDKIPWKVLKTINTLGCEVETIIEPKRLDCDFLKLHRNVAIPCISAKKGITGGTLVNGTYYATIAYTVNGQKVTDYLSLSNAVGIFSHENTFGALEIQIDDLDDSFDEYELVIVSITGDLATVAKRIGIYGTNQSHIFLDIISEDLISVPLELLPIRNHFMDSSDSITQLGDSMIRVAPKSKFDFNYQPLANQIEIRWAAVEYPADYYRNGGTNTNHLRDENLALFIRWIYDDSDRSSSFHIPGRAPSIRDQALESGIYDNNYHFENVNTASMINTTITKVDELGYQIAEGLMGYFESDERYPINKPTVWTNLCGKKIRHHKLPDRNTLGPYSDIYSDVALSPIQGPVIRVMGIRALNIKPPVDNEGRLIPGIVGYELLRGSRQGNKTIIAKGIVNNMFSYDLEPTGEDSNKTHVAIKTGLYPNFPYNSVKDDGFISTTVGITHPLTGILTNITKNKGYYSPEGTGTLNPKFPHEMVTFHSPDTTFRRPFLGGKELKLCGIISGEPILKFYEPNEHPRHKIPTNFAFFIASIAGLGLAILKMSGPRSSSNGLPNVGGITGASTTGLILLTSAIVIGIANKRDKSNQIDESFNDFADVTKARNGNIDSLEAQDRSNATQLNLNEASVMNSANKNSIFGSGLGTAMGVLFRGVGGISLFSQQWSEGISTVFDIINSFSQWQQYALQQISHCFYNHYGDLDNGINPSSKRILIKNSKYLDPSFQDFDDQYRINNLYRSRTVAMKLTVNMPNPKDWDGNLEDTSKEPLQAWPNPYAGDYDDPTYYFRVRRASSYYASLKIRLRNQYGQIGDVKQIPIGCVNYVTIVPNLTNVFESPVIFGGDTYITRYTEKNTMFFFYDWLYKKFDGEEYDYFKSRMIQYPSYWVNTKKFDMGDFVRGLTDFIGGNVVSLLNPNLNTAPNAQIDNSGWLPSAMVSLDRPPGATNTFVQNGATQGFITSLNKKYAYRNSLFIVKAAYFYLFVSGVRDFYVESEINLGYRDWEEPVIKRHYDEASYSDLVQMFDANPDIIKADNYYKYDFALSVSHSFEHMISWGNVQPTYYDPQIAEFCYVMHPNRLVYSLPQQTEQIRDSWRVFLANNYRDFHSKINTVKSIGDNGAIILFERESPIQIQGTETLETVRGTKITLGDGELLKQAQQNLTNADRMYQHGACQSLRSVINTPMGLFFISQSQGKIMYILNGMMDIAMQDMNDWFVKYLPYFILKDFPNYDNLDNPVSGVGCQAVYDNQNEIIYFTKKDYKLKKESLQELNAVAIYDSSVKKFYMVLPKSGDTGHGHGPGDNEASNLVHISLSDPLYFEDVSWTISYDIKEKKWLGWHDWHPELTMPSQRTFFTIKNDGIWEHNVRCDLFCNYYGIDYPFEIEYPYNTTIPVNILKSVEYYLEIYKYANNCDDRYLYMTENFDEMIVHNSEQVSGVLKLIRSSFEDPFEDLKYPIDNGNSLDILYSYVENKFRVNMFYDITDDRGMFTNARRQIWSTASNGYHKTLNPVNLDYQKSYFERKAFRGYKGSVLFRKKVSGNNSFIMLFAINKLLQSYR